MTNEKRSEALSQALQKRIKTFTRLEKAFYGAIIITAITLVLFIYKVAAYKFSRKSAI